MKSLMQASLGNIPALLLVLLPLLTMVFFGHSFYADSKNPEWANVSTGAGSVLAASVSDTVAFQVVALVEESQRPNAYWQQTSLHWLLCGALGWWQWKKTIQFKKVTSKC